jgi:1-acyl-sn-glycerol-3-phosphate acyltransferase
MSIILRSIIFDIIFYIYSAIFFIFFFPAVIILDRNFVFWTHAIYGKSILFLSTYILNLNIKIEGIENLKEINSPYIIAFEHQSALDTFIPSIFFKNFVFVLKNELLYVPFFGTYLKRSDSIFIKRKEGLKAVKTLIYEGKKSAEKGYNILIYPQGTRAIWHEPSKCEAGIFMLYDHLNIPIIPVTIDSGKYWPRKTLLKKPGIVKIQIEKPIMTGLKKNDLLKTLENIFDKDIAETF